MLATEIKGALASQNKQSVDEELNQLKEEIIQKMRDWIQIKLKKLKEVIVAELHKQRIIRKPEEFL